MDNEPVVQDAQPLNRNEKLQAIKEALNSGGEKPSEPDTDQGDDQEGGQDEAPSHDRGDGSQSSDDVPEPRADDDPVEDVSEADAQDATSVSLSEVAKELDVDVAELYDVSIPLGRDGKSVTLGEMKDSFKEYGDVHEYRERVEQKNKDTELSLLATRSHLNQLMPLLPPETAQALIKQASQNQKGWEKEQEQLVLEAMPEWSDTDARAKDRDAIIAIGAKYGFSEPEMTYTQDARTLRMLRDFAKMQRQQEEGRKQLKERKRKAVTRSAGKRGGGGRLAQRIAAAKQSTDGRVKSAAVRDILNSRG